MGRHIVSWCAQHWSETLEDAQPAYDRFIDTTFGNTGIFLQ
jgi:hypothetical protein